MEQPSHNTEAFDRLAFIVCLPMIVVYLVGFSILGFLLWGNREQD